MGEGVKGIREPLVSLGTKTCVYIVQDPVNCQTVLWPPVLQMLYTKLFIVMGILWMAECLEFLLKAKKPQEERLSGLLGEIENVFRK